MLQIKPSENYGLRPLVQEFHLAEAIDVARSESRANPQFGPGGGVKLFIPTEKHRKALVPIGDLVPLLDSVDEPAPEAVGFLETVIDLEVSWATRSFARTANTRAEDVASGYRSPSTPTKWRV